MRSCSILATAAKAAAIASSSPSGSARRRRRGSASANSTRVMQTVQVVPNGPLGARPTKSPGARRSKICLRPSGNRRWRQAQPLTIRPAWDVAGLSRTISRPVGSSSVGPSRPSTSSCSASEREPRRASLETACSASRRHRGGLATWAILAIRRALLRGGSLRSALPGSPASRAGQRRRSRGECRAGHSRSPG